MTTHVIETEADITRAVVDTLRAFGFWVLKVHGHLGQRAGVPDVITCYRGLFVAIEVKAPRGQLTDRQRREIEAVQGVGGIAVVVRSVEETLALIERVQRIQR